MKKMSLLKKSFLLVAIIIVALIIDFVSVNYMRLSHFEHRIKERMGEGDVALFPLREMTSFEWDRVVTLNSFFGFESQNKTSGSTTSRLMILSDKFDVGDEFMNYSIVDDTFTRDEYFYVISDRGRYRLLRANSRAIEFCHNIFRMENDALITLRADELFAFDWVYAKVNLSSSSSYDANCHNFTFCENFPSKEKLERSIAFGVPRALMTMNANGSETSIELIPDSRINIERRKGHFYMKVL